MSFDPNERCPMPYLPNTDTQHNDDGNAVPPRSGSKRSTLDIEGKIAEWRERAAVPAVPAVPTAPAAPVGGDTRLLLAGDEVVCQLVPAALIDDLKTRLDAKDEDNESGIHESE